MSSEALGVADRARLFRSAALLFGFGLLLGLVFTFNLIGDVVAWPLLPSTGLSIPGTEAGWRRAHLGGIVNALAMMAFAAAGASLRLGETGRRLYGGFTQLTGWCNSIGFFIAALTGTRGLGYGGSLANSLVYLLFLVAVCTAIGQTWLLWRGANQALHEAR